MMIGVWIFGDLYVGIIDYVSEECVGDFRGQDEISSTGVSWYLSIF